MQKKLLIIPIILVIIIVAFGCIPAEFRNAIYIIGYEYILDIKESKNNRFDIYYENKEEFLIINQLLRNLTEKAKDGKAVFSVYDDGNGSNCTISFPKSLGDGNIPLSKTEQQALNTICNALRERENERTLDVIKCTELLIQYESSSVDKVYANDKALVFADSSFEIRRFFNESETISGEKIYTNVFIKKVIK